MLECVRSHKLCQKTSSQRVLCYNARSFTRAGLSWGGMAINYLNGIRFRNAILAGAESLIAQQEAINQINVFPVPDGDTGTNMALTLKAVADTAQKAKRPKLSTLAESLAHTALMHARGNSGAIVAQFFQGIARGFSGKTRVTVKEFSEVVVESVEASRHALADPKEGTILTVMEDWANYIQHAANANESSPCFRRMMNKSLDVAKRSLQETPEKLEVLAEANVVDAGAQGFTYFLEGVVDFVEEGHVRVQRFTGPDVPTALDQQHAIENYVDMELQSIEYGHAPHELHHGNIQYQYCTECIVQGHDLDPDELRSKLTSWGDCLIVLGNRREIKIHIHTNAPDLLFKQLSEKGELLQTKAEDMWSQYRKCIDLELNNEIALITDSSCSLPQDFVVKHNIKLVPLHVMFGAEAYLDTVNITVDEFYNKLKASDVAATTSQPTPADFMRVYEIARKQSKQAIGIFLSSKVSGTFQAAQFAAEHTKDFPVYVFDSGNTASGLGLIVQIAAEAIQQNKPIKEIKRRIRLAIERTSIYVSPKTIDYMVKGGRISRPAGKFASLLKLLPIIGLENSYDKPKRLAMTRGLQANRDKLFALIRERVAGLKNVRFMVTHAQAPDEAEKMAERLKKEFHVSDVPVSHVMPALGAHAGPGAIAVSVLAFEPEDKAF